MDINVEKLIKGEVESIECEEFEFESVDTILRESKIPTYCWLSGNGLITIERTDMVLEELNYPSVKIRDYLLKVKSNGSNLKLTVDKLPSVDITYEYDVNEIFLLTVKVVGLKLDDDEIASKEITDFLDEIQIFMNKYKNRKYVIKKGE